MKGREQVCMVG